MLKRALITAILLTTPFAAIAGPYEDGQAAYTKGEYDQALVLYNEAATAGHVDAQLLLGFLHFNGDGVGQDYNTAVRWFTKAARQGDARSQAQLGIMYENGQGVPQDFGAAAQWYNQAADQGYSLAQAALGLMYAVGQGVKQDFPRAHMWLNLAAAQQYQGAQDNRDEVSKRMTTDQITEAQRMARKWLEKKSEQ